MSDLPSDPNDTKALARYLLGNTGELVTMVLLKHAEGVIKGLHEVHAELQRVKRQRDNARICVDTLVANLQCGAAVESVLAWYERKGRALAQEGE